MRCIHKPHIEQGGIDTGIAIKSNKENCGHFILTL